MLGFSTEVEATARHGGVQTSVEALLRPVHNFFGMPRNLRVRSCKQGNPKIITAETKTKDRV